MEEVKDLIKVQGSTKERGYKFNDRYWTKESDPLYWKDCIQYCTARNARLGTLDEIVDLRHARNGEKYTYDTQHTSTLVGHVADGFTQLCAHVYEPSAKEMINIAKKIDAGDSYIDVEKKSKLGRKIQKYSEKTNRVLRIPPKSVVLNVTANQDGMSEYSTNEFSHMLMPRNAEKNAAIIQRHDGEVGHMFFYYEWIPEDVMRIMPVIIAGLNHIIYANGCFDMLGRAQGIVSESEEVL